MKGLGENTEKYISFSIPLKVENDEGKKILCKLKFIDSMRFMMGSLADHADNLSDLNSVLCNKCMERNKTLSQCHYVNNENNHLIYKCKECNSNTHRPSNHLKEKFRNTYKLCNNDLDKFMLLTTKGFYPYE